MSALSGWDDVGPRSWASLWTLPPPGLTRYCGYPGVYPTHTASPPPSIFWITSCCVTAVSVLAGVSPPLVPVPELVLNTCIDLHYT